MDTIQFKKYSSIENHYRDNYINYIIEQGLDDVQWVVTEKAHGSNFQFATDGTNVKCGKRSEFLNDNDNFFNWETIYDKYHEAIMNIFTAIKQKHSDTIQITIYGELYGGYYKCKDIKDVPNASKVQKGVCYCPHNDFIVFDIYRFINDTSKGLWMNFIDVIDLCKTYGLMILEPLFIGSFKKALEYPNEFESNIYKYHNLPMIENNIAEGIVIKPIISKHFHSGERVIIKSKNTKFAENVGSPRLPKQPEIYSEDAMNHINKMKLLVSENRLRNVLSKFGLVTNKDFGKILSLLIADIIEEYLKDNPDTYNSMGKTYKKQVTKMITKMAAELIRPNFLNIIDGTF